MDMDLLGESCGGPLAQRGLRRSKPFEVGTWKSLLHGALLARGAQQKSDEGEAPVPCDTDVVLIHSGGRPDILASARQMFRLEKSKQVVNTDAWEKKVGVVFNEEGIRQRKKRIKTSDGYSQQTDVFAYTQKGCVPETFPERRRKHYSGYNTGDVIGWVDCVGSDDLWVTSRFGFSPENRKPSTPTLSP